MSEAEHETVLRQRAKAMMRKRARQLRNSLPAAAIAARSARICAHLAALEEVTAAASVALFWPMEARNEVDLRPLDAQLREAGTAVAYPRIDPDTRAMTFHRVDDPSQLAEAGMGFREPPSAAPEQSAVAVVVVPGLLFDAVGHRIGYGGGFYDRTLPRYVPPGVSIGVAFDFQLAADLPRSGDDVAVHVVVTDTRVMRIDASC